LCSAGSAEEGIPRRRRGPMNARKDIVKCIVGEVWGWAWMMMLVFSVAKLSKSWMAMIDVGIVRNVCK
jgi:hypothetical protein